MGNKQSKFIISRNRLRKVNFQSFKCGKVPSFIFIATILVANAITLSYFNNSYAQISSEASGPFVGVNMRGLYTAISQSKSTASENSTSSFPPNYYEDSFRILSDAGMNHVRYTFYWEGFIVNPEAFINELLAVANTADKYGIKVLYDNHQFHTSSYLNPQRGNGFPYFLFEGSSAVPTFHMVAEDRPNMRVPKHGGQTGGTDRLWMQMALMAGF